MLSETARRLQAEVRTLTARLLARETGVPEGVAAEFLRQLRGEAVDVTRRKEERQQGRVQRLEEEFAKLEAASQTPSCAPDSTNNTNNTNSQPPMTIPPLRQDYQKENCAMSKQHRTQQHTHGQPMLTTVAPTSSPQDTVHLTLHETDPVTGNEDSVSMLFYEYYRGYTIYSTEHGRCCIHGKDGCVRLRGLFVSLPDIEDA